MKFNITDEKKKEAFQHVIFELEKELMLRLYVLNIDPEDFDENSFQPREDSTAEKDIYNLILKIKNITEKMNSI